MLLHLSLTSQARCDWSVLSVHTWTHRRLTDCTHTTTLAACWLQLSTTSTITSAIIVCIGVITCIASSSSSSSGGGGDTESAASIEIKPICDALLHSFLLAVQFTYLLLALGTCYLELAEILLFGVNQHGESLSSFCLRTFSVSWHSITFAWSVYQRCGYY